VSTQAVQPRAVSVYRVAEEFIEWQDRTESMGGEVTPESEAILLDIMGRIPDAIEHAAGLVRALEAEAAEIRAEEKRLAERRATCDRTAEALRLAIGVTMDASGRKTFKGVRFTVTRRIGAESCEVVNADEVPAQFWKPRPPVVDKVAAIEAFKAWRLREPADNESPEWAEWQSEKPGGIEMVRGDATLQIK
jgi:hypothetical protein